jgi:hypothetical protein
MNAITRHSEGVNFPGPRSVAFYDDKKFLDVSRGFHLCDYRVTRQGAEQENCAEKFFHILLRKSVKKTIMEKKHDIEGVYPVLMTKPD